MSKFLRKYQSWILVVGGTLLMIAFLVPQALQQMGSDNSGRTVMTLSSGRKVTSSEMQNSIHSYKTAQGLLPGFMYTFRIAPDQPMHWFLNTEVARDAGFLGPKGDGADPVFAEMLAYEEYQAIMGARYGGSWRQNEQLIAQVDPDGYQAARSRFTSTQAALGQAVNGAPTRDGLRLDEMIAGVRGVRRMREAFVGVPAVSQPRLLVDAKHQYDTALVSYVIAPIDERQLASVPEPTDAEIAAHFEKFKGVKQGEGDFGLGYDMPAQVKLQWLTIDRLKLYTLAEPDPVTVQDRLLSLAPSADDTKTRRQQVQMQIKNEMADRAVRVAQEAVKNEILLALSKLPDQPGSKLKAVPAAGAVDMNALAKLAADKAGASLGVTVEPFKVESTTDWQTQQNAMELPGIGRALFRAGSSFTPAMQLVFSAHELAPANQPPLPVQVGLPIAAALEDLTSERPPRTNNAYFAIVTAVRPAGPPANLDEVKARVVSDLKKIALHTKLVATGALLSEQAREISIADVQASLIAANPKVQAVREGVRVARAGRGQLSEPGMADDTIVEAIMTRAQKIDYTQPVDPKDPALNFSLVVPKQFAIVIVQITGFDPLTQEGFRSIAQAASNNKIVRDMRDAMDEPFALPALAKRYSVDVSKRSQD